MIFRKKHNPNTIRRGTIFLLDDLAHYYQTMKLSSILHQGEDLKFTFGEFVDRFTIAGMRVE